MADLTLDGSLNLDCLTHKLGLSQKEGEDGSLQPGELGDGSSNQQFTEATLEEQAAIT